MVEPLLNILIVEDNPGDIVLVKEIIRLSGLNFRLTHSSSLRDALKLSRNNVFDIILVDLGLPDSQGLNTLKQLNSGIDKSPIVVMTGLDDEDTALQALREGAQDYLVKNRITEDGLVRTIKYSIERKKIKDLEKKTSQRFSILSAATAALNECFDIPSLLGIICTNLRLLLENAGVLAIEFPEPGLARFTGLEWMKHKFDEIQRITGYNLNHPVFKVKQDEKNFAEAFENSRLRRIDGGFIELFKGYINEAVSLNIEEVLDVKFIYTIGFHQHNIFYGGFLILAKNPIPDNDRAVIETITNQTSLNIHRRTIEKHLRLSEDRYKKLNIELELKVKERTSDLETLNRQLQKELSVRIQAEKALKESEGQLKELNATKDKFFNIVAHDLKNPFTSLLGSSELLFQNIENLDREHIRKLSIILNDSAKSGYAILQNLLDWSRSQTGLLKISPEALNLKSIVEENIVNLELFSSNKNITIQSVIQKDIYIYADKNMINTVLRNLISNALKFSYREGVVIVEAQAGTKIVTISVRDFGTGISHENIDKLFRIDTKYTMPGTENEVGTGLGLKLSREFVEKQGGRIWVKSEEKRGSEFIFTVPAKN